MSPNVIRDEFSHIPDANKRMRARWAKAGLCARCGKSEYKMKGKKKLSSCEECLNYFKSLRQANKNKFDKPNGLDKI